MIQNLGKVQDVSPEADLNIHGDLDSNKVDTKVYLQTRFYG